MIFVPSYVVEHKLHCVKDVDSAGNYDYDNDYTRVAAIDHDNYEDAGQNDDDTLIMIIIITTTMMMVMIINLNYLFTCLLNSQKDNYSVSTSKRWKQTNTHKQKTKDKSRQLMLFRQ
jgi:hypothetical protein